jgi:hypothetical protein
MRLILNSIIDWDGALAVPLLATTHSLNKRMFMLEEYRSREERSLNKTQDTLFRTEMLRIEQERSSSDQLSVLHQESKRNLVLDELHYIHNWTREAIKDTLPSPELVNEALNRSPPRLAHVAAEWNSFANQFYSM